MPLSTTMDGFLPHSICLALDPALIWLHAASDSITALAYYSIPFALVFFGMKRNDPSFRWVFFLFGAFILACGTTHLLGVWTLWRPDYGLQGYVKAATALISAATAILLWPMMPRALALPSPAQLAAVNLVLHSQIAERQLADETVRRINAELEQRVRERTAELERSNAALRAEIEQRKKAEDGLRLAKEEAERANIAKSKFLAAASHDMRQPVQALFCFVELLSTLVSSTAQHSAVEKVFLSLRALADILESLLDVSKLDAGVISVQKTAVPVAQLFERMEAEFRPLASQKGLDLRIVSSTNVLDSDPALLARILQNFIANAVRYTARGRILIGCRRRRDCLSIEVWDSGIGIPQDQLSEIFEEFHQIGNSERDRSQGLGLGLAIVRRLGHLLHHPIHVRSTVGHGSVFAVEVPLAVECAR